MDMLSKAIEIAARAHAGQRDKGGEPYILHPLRVMFSMESETERICAVLHDVIEDADITLDYLRQEGFTEQVLNVLSLLTRREEESYDDFISRILVDTTACRVKLADLQDNMNLARIPHLSDADLLRAEKYRNAIKRIQQRLEA